MSYITAFGAFVGVSTSGSSHAQSSGSILAHVHTSGPDTNNLLGDAKDVFVMSEQLRAETMGVQQGRHDHGLHGYGRHQDFQRHCLHQGHQGQETQSNEQSQDYRGAVIATRGSVLELLAALGPQFMLLQTQKAQHMSSGDKAAVAADDVLIAKETMRRAAELQG